MPDSCLYKLIIVDDEQKIRLGLKNIIDWKDMGFEVIHDFSDGDQVIDYLKRDTADVILTDVKMNRASGLEIAKYVHDNNLPSIVVLLSAYKEFELAQKAVSTNVFHYLLKPLKLDELYQVFSDIKKELDSLIEKQAQGNSYNKDTIPLRNFFCQQFLKDLVNGIHYNDSNIEEINRCFPVEFKWDSYLLAILDVKSLLGDRSKNTSQSKEILPYYSDVSGRTILSLDYSAGKVVIFIETLTGEETLDYSTVLGISKKTVEYNMQAQMPDVKMGISCVHCGHEQVSLAFWEAQYALESICNENKSKAYESFDEINSESFIKIINESDAIYKNICEGDSQTVGQLTRLTVDKIWALDESETKKKNYIVQVFSSIYYKASEHLPINNDISMVINYDYILKETDIRMISDYLVKCLVSLSKLYISLNSKMNNILIKKAVAYIRNNFSKEDISLNTIAEAIYLSPSYFSRMFKEYTGENVSDYIIRLRINMSRELLRNTNLNINDITEKIGYTSSKYFSKLFRKVVGLTPSAYRNSIRKVNDEDS